MDVALRMRAETGQASVELVAMLPLMAALALGLLHLLAAGAAWQAADGAAEAGAIALLQDADPRSAARDALPGWARRSAAIAVDGRRVRVRVRPRGPVPSLTRRLASVAVAHAGPAPEAGR